MKSCIRLVHEPPVPAAGEVCLKVYDAAFVDPDKEHPHIIPLGLPVCAACGAEPPPVESVITPVSWTQIDRHFAMHSRPPPARHRSEVAFVPYEDEGTAGGES